MRTIAIVIAIIALLVFVVPSYIWQIDTGEKTTRYRLDVVSARIAAWARNYRRLPTHAEGLSTVLAEGGRKDLESTIGIDTWRHPIHYHLKSDALRHCASVYSDGPNGIDEGGAGDDIVGSMTICE